MSERWVPLLAAAVGLLGGIGGAYVGGKVANERQQDRFENEQRVEARNIRMDAYVDFLKACETAFNFSDKLDPVQVSRGVGELYAAQSRASLVTSSADVAETAGRLARACQVSNSDPVVGEPGRRFIHAAQGELASSD
jgi:hypothetical protein